MADSEILRRAALLALLLLAAVCTACIWLMSQSSFASTFSLKELLQRNQVSGLDCLSSGGAGDGIGVGAGGFGRISEDSSFHKGESFSCRISDAQQFDEAKFIRALKESIEKDLNASDVKIISSKITDATRFSIEYTLADRSGRVQISGTRSPGNYYSLSAELDEKTGKSQ